MRQVLVTNAQSVGLGWSRGLRWIQKGISVRWSKGLICASVGKGSKCWLESRVEMRQVMEKDPSVGQFRVQAAVKMPRDELGTPKKGLGTPGSGKSIDSILPCVRGSRGSKKGIDLILPPARRTRETPGSGKVTHLPLRSAAQNPKKAIESIPPCARRTRDSRLRNLARTGLESPGSGKGIDLIANLARAGSETGIGSILTLRVQDPKKVSTQS
ncbi:hypothetical protein R1flu_008717 [Riccia fluitans]|uniref:Uncharacterized protein n=1 Tax=Riccia fluitans TaxID=41844 RepID=A0ABD1YFL7_9MARC